MPCDESVNVCLPDRGLIMTHLPEPGWPMSRIFLVAARSDDMVAERGISGRDDDGEEKRREEE